MAANGAGRVTLSKGGAGRNGLPKIHTEKRAEGICHDDSTTPVKAQTIDELHSLQRKKSAPTTPINVGAQAPFAPSEDERRKQQLQSISASLASLTRETGPKVVKGDPARQSETPRVSHVSHPYFTPTIDVSDSSLKFTHVLYNLSPAELYEQAIKYEKGSFITSSGALATLSGAKTGRSPKDKRVVRDESTEDVLWWGKGSPNIEMDEHTFMVNRERAVDYLNSLEKVFVNDQFLNWDPENRIKVRIVSARAYHSLFMHNMCIRPTPEELENFGTPDFTIYNAGQFPCNRYTHYMTSSTSIDLNLGRREMVILGTQYAGEMKKGLFSVMHYLMPLRQILSLHSGCNMGKDGDVALFFGLSGKVSPDHQSDEGPSPDNRYVPSHLSQCFKFLNEIDGCALLKNSSAFIDSQLLLFFFFPFWDILGTGKTTLSTDHNRYLIGDDEHCWSDNGVSNIEGGCYAKCIDLSKEKEPDIWNAIRFGTVLENVVFDEHTREVDYSEKSVTENTRAAYPIEYIPNAQLPCVASHPKNVILLACDAFGVLPPVSKLSLAQTMYHFISGYTALVAGTEEGVKEPQATFSACFGAAFIMLHPTKYAAMLSSKMQKHGATGWLVNTGWSGGSYGSGSRIKLAYTRKIIDAIHSGSLLKAKYEKTEVFGLEIPTEIEGVPSEILEPMNTWPDKKAYKETLLKLGGLFKNNFEVFVNHKIGKDGKLTDEILAAGPVF
ncbi:phosphoenolpyruvate carboxykinase (ATP) 1 isoform X1 [Henckelia pumila]|uniref:phosphoenolpyruvate carboxykinase (ATP) 1 isoform X1 n=1 Tax=Henckelia pumila TaxID=405737 RepID=UPI003C6E8D47